ncbi:MAG: glycosyltransferase [Pseudomonadota bacterium]
MNSNADHSLMITPIFPDSGGNGLARRAAMFVNAMAKVGNVDVLVLPIFGSGRTGMSASAMHPSVRCFQVPATALPDSRFALLKMLPDPAERLSAFKSFGKPSVFGSISAGVLSASLAQTAQQAYRHVHVFRTYCAPLGLNIAHHLQKQQGAALIKTLDVDEDDASVYGAIADAKARNGMFLEGLWDQQEADAHEGLSRDVLAEFNAVFVSSQIERRRLISRHNAVSIVASNAVNAGLPINKMPSSGMLLFVGTMGYYPNQHAMDWFLCNCWPLLAKARGGLSVTIAGAGPTRVLQRYNRVPGIRALGWVDDIERYYRDASLFLAPLQIGGGTRLKLLEAATYGLPIVSTAKGAEGLNLSNHRDYWQADLPELFVQSIMHAISGKNERTRRAVNARRNVSLHHDLERVTNKVANAFHTLLK